MRIANINDADKEQWKEWQRLSVAERLDHSCMIWADTYELRKNAKKTSEWPLKIVLEALEENKVLYIL